MSINDFFYIWSSESSQFTGQTYTMFALGIIISITAFFIFKKKNFIPFIIIIIASILAYLIFTAYVGTGTGEVTIGFLIFIVALSTLYKLSHYLEKITKNKS